MVQEEISGGPAKSPPSSPLASKIEGGSVAGVISVSQIKGSKEHFSSRECIALTVPGTEFGGCHVLIVTARQEFCFITSNQIDLFHKYINPI